MGLIEQPHEELDSAAQLVWVHGVSRSVAVAESPNHTESACSSNWIACRKASTSSPGGCYWSLVRLLFQPRSEPRHLATSPLFVFDGPRIKRRLTHQDPRLHEVRRCQINVFVAR